MFLGLLLCILIEFRLKNSGFSNIEPSYGHFKLFGRGYCIIAVFVHRCTIKYMTNLPEFVAYISRNMLSRLPLLVILIDILSKNWYNALTPSKKFKMGSILLNPDRN